jgi:hypothetical protein
LRIIQGDAVRNISGYVRAVIQPWINDAGGYADGALFRDEGPIGVGDDGNMSDEMRHFSFNASRVVPTANEIRPVNTAVRYLIRALP